MRTRPVVSVLVVSLLAAGCIWPFGRKDDEEPPEEQEPVTLVVTNHNWSDVVVYVLPSGAHIRLGSVVTGQVVEFVLPLTYAPSGVVSLLIDPIGSRETFRTGNILVSPGQRLEVTVENQLRATSWSVAALSRPTGAPADR